MSREVAGFLIALGGKRLEAELRAGGITEEEIVQARSGETSYELAQKFRHALEVRRVVESAKNAQAEEGRE